MKTVELKEGARVTLYFDRKSSGTGFSAGGESGVIDLSGKSAALVVVGEVVYANDVTVFARLRDLPKKSIFGQNARLVYAMFAESYECEVIVEPASELGKSSCAIKILSPWLHLNRRAYVRVPVEFPVKLTDKELPTGISLLHRTKDISNSGLGVYVPNDHSFARDMKVMLEMQLPDGLLEVEAKVTSVRDGVLGLEFINLRTEAERRIGRAVFHAQVVRKRLLIE